MQEWVAGEAIGAGEMVRLGADGKVYRLGDNRKTMSSLLAREVASGRITLRDAREANARLQGAQ